MFTFIAFTLVIAWLVHAYNPKYALVRPVHEFYLNKVVFQNRVSRAGFKRMDGFLESYVDFYKQLSLEGRAKFIHRLELFVADKRFRPMNDFPLTEEHKWLLCSGAIMITFGLNEYMLRGIREIWVYPSEFYLSQIGKFLKGGATKNKVMLSWNNLKAGFADSEDALNLSIHEFAHAFELNLQRESDSDRRFLAYADVLEDIKSDAFTNLTSSDENTLRAYARTNRNEFFAVSMEYFFERPMYLFKTYPNLFVHLCVALNMNPLAIKTDYVLDDGFVDASNNDAGTVYIPSSVPKFLLNDRYQWPQYANIIGFFVALPITIALFVQFHEKALSFWYMWLIGGLGTAVFAYRRYISSGYMVGFTLTAYSFLGVAPMIMAVFMAVNTLWPAQGRTFEAWCEIHQIYPQSERVLLTANESLPFDHVKFNPVQLPLGVIERYGMNPKDSLKVRFETEHHFPGWLNVKSIQPIEFKTTK